MPWALRASATREVYVLPGGTTIAMSSAGGGALPSAGRNQDEIRPTASRASQVASGTTWTEPAWALPGPLVLRSHAGHHAGVGSARQRGRGRWRGGAFREHDIAKPALEGCGVRARARVAARASRRPGGPGRDRPVPARRSGPTRCEGTRRRGADSARKPEGHLPSGGWPSTSPNPVAGPRANDPCSPQATVADPARRISACCRASATLAGSAVLVRVAGDAVASSSFGDVLHGPHPDAEGSLRTG